MSSAIPNSKTMQDFAAYFCDLSIGDDQAIELAEHVVRLSSVVQALAAQMDGSDQPAHFGELLSRLKQSARN